MFTTQRRVGKSQFKSSRFKASVPPSSLSQDIFTKSDQAQGSGLVVKRPRYQTSSASPSVSTDFPTYSCQDQTHYLPEFILQSLNNLKSPIEFIRATHWAYGFIKNELWIWNCATFQVLKSSLMPEDEESDSLFVECLGENQLVVVTITLCGRLRACFLNPDMPNATQAMVSIELSQGADISSVTTCLNLKTLNILAIGSDSKLYWARVSQGTLQSRGLAFERRQRATKEPGSLWKSITGSIFTTSSSDATSLVETPHQKTSETFSSSCHLIASIDQLDGLVKLDVLIFDDQKQVLHRWIRWKERNLICWTLPLSAIFGPSQTLVWHPRKCWNGRILPVVLTQESGPGTATWTLSHIRFPFSDEEILSTFSTALPTIEESNQSVLPSMLMNQGNPPTQMDVMVAQDQDRFVIYWAKTHSIGVGHKDAFSILPLHKTIINLSLVNKSLVVLQSHDNPFSGKSSLECIHVIPKVWSKTSPMKASPHDDDDDDGDSPVVAPKPSVVSISFSNVEEAHAFVQQALEDYTSQLENKTPPVVNIVDIAVEKQIASNVYLNQAVIQLDQELLDAKPSTGLHWSSKSRGESSKSSNARQRMTPQLARFQLQEKLDAHDRLKDFVKAFNAQNRLDISCHAEIEQHEEQLAAAFALCRLQHQFSSSAQDHEQQSATKTYSGKVLSQAMTVTIEKRGFTPEMLRNFGLNVSDVFFGEVTRVIEIVPHVFMPRDLGPDLSSSLIAELMEANVVYYALYDAVVEHRRVRSCGKKNSLTIIPEWMKARVIRNTLKRYFEQVSQCVLSTKNPPTNRTGQRQELLRQLSMLGTMHLNGYQEQAEVLDRQESMEYNQLKSWILDPALDEHLRSPSKDNNDIGDKCETYHYYIGLIVLSQDNREALHRYCASYGRPFLTLVFEWYAGKLEHPIFHQPNVHQRGELFRLPTVYTAQVLAFLTSDAHLQHQRWLVHCRNHEYADMQHDLWSQMKGDDDDQPISPTDGTNAHKYQWMSKKESKFHWSLMQLCTQAQAPDELSPVCTARLPEIAFHLKSIQLMEDYVLGGSVTPTQVITECIATGCQHLTRDHHHDGLERVLSGFELLEDMSCLNNTTSLEPQEHPHNNPLDIQRACWTHILSFDRECWQDTQEDVALERAFTHSFMVRIVEAYHRASALNELSGRMNLSLALLDEILSNDLEGQGHIISNVSMASMVHKAFTFALRSAASCD